MKRSKDILRRVTDDEALRAAGLTEDEIRELSGLRDDYESQDSSFREAVKIEEELTELRRREQAGTLTEQDQKRLDARLGVFYTITICGHTWKINHCFVARACLGLFVLIATLNVIFMAAYLAPKHKQAQLAANTVEPAALEIPVDPVDPTDED